MYGCLDDVLLNIEHYLEQWHNNIDSHYLFEEIKKFLLNILSPYITDIEVIGVREKEIRGYTSEVDG